MKNLHTEVFPPLQAAFLSQWDGTIESAVKFESLHMILNPCFTGHYFLDHVKPNGDVVSTKQTTGEWAYWGKQTEEQVQNASKLSVLLRKFILAHPHAKADKNKKGKYRIAVMLNNTPVIVKGLTA